MTEEQIKIIDAVVDGLFAIARAIERLARAVERLPVDGPAQGNR